MRNEDRSYRIDVDAHDAISGQRVVDKIKDVLFAEVET